MCRISSLCYLREVPLACLQSRRGPLPSGWSRCEWPWDKTFQTCWSYTNKLLYPSTFLLLGLMPAPAVHISDRNYVGGWIPSCPPVTWALSFFTSCGTKVTLISGRTILERQLVQKDAKMENALCCREGVQTAINRTCVIILGYVMKRLTTTSFLPQYQQLLFKFEDTGWGRSALLKRSWGSYWGANQTWARSLPLQQAISWAASARVQPADQGEWLSHSTWHLLGHNWNTVSWFSLPSSRETLKNWGGSREGSWRWWEDYRTWHEEKLKKLGLLVLEKERLQGDVVTVFQCLKCSYWEDEGMPFTRMHRVASREILSGYKKKMFHCETIKHWTRLSREVVESPSLETLKTWPDRALGNQRLCFQHKAGPEVPSRWDLASSLELYGKLRWPLLHRWFLFTSIAEDKHIPTFLSIQFP